MHATLSTRALLPLLLLALAPLTRAADISITDHTLTIPAGAYPVPGATVTVSAATTLTVTPPAPVTVTDEPLKLSPDKPAGWAKGTRLMGPNARDVNANGSFVPGSLTLRRAPDAPALKLTDDYLLDEAWGHLGLGARTTLTPNDTVLASYQYALLRMDTLQVSPDGKPSLKTGEPHVSAPVPPAPDVNHTAIAHLLVHYDGSLDVYRILESPAQAVTATTPGRIPRTLAKLKSGQPVKIVCWGDSVTAGGNASTPERRYVDVFAAGLKQRFPHANLTVDNLSAGGSNSRQWLFPDKFPYRGLRGDDNPARFDRVLAAKPELVTIEFVNDAPLKPEQVEETYNDILARLSAINAEVILITPHFTMLKMMGNEKQSDPDRRPYVLALRAFADRHHVALADASARWQHLHAEGLPYLTLLHNTINHPGDRGHRLFAEELWKCFED